MKLPWEKGIGGRKQDLELGSGRTLRGWVTKSVWSLNWVIRLCFHTPGLSHERNLFLSATRGYTWFRRKLSLMMEFLLRLTSFLCFLLSTAKPHKFYFKSLSSERMWIHVDRDDSMPSAFQVGKLYGVSVVSGCTAIKGLSLHKKTE